MSIFGGFVCKCWDYLTLLQTREVDWFLPKTSNFEHFYRITMGFA